MFWYPGGPLVWQDPQHIIDSDKGLRLVGIVSYGKRECGTTEAVLHSSQQLHFLG